MAGDRVLISLSEEEFDNLIDCILIAEEEFASVGLTDVLETLYRLRLRLEVCAVY